LKRSRNSGVLRLFRREHFDGDVAFERELVRQVDGTHAAAPEQALNPVLKSDRVVERLAQRIGRCVRRARFDARAAGEAEPRLARQVPHAFATPHGSGES
jgi:hypothetical protein